MGPAEPHGQEMVVMKTNVKDMRKTMNAMILSFNNMAKDMEQMINFKLTCDDALKTHKDVLQVFEIPHNF